MTYKKKYIIGGISAIFNTYNDRRRRDAEAFQDPRFALQVCVVCVCVCVCVYVCVCARAHKKGSSRRCVSGGGTERLYIYVLKTDNEMAFCIHTYIHG